MAVLLPQICDFGLAKWKEYSLSQTQALSRSHRAGTVTHMPPEMWIDINHPRTVHFDVYSFAILLWELFAEQRPFKNGIMHHVRGLYSVTREPLYIQPFRLGENI